MENNEDFQSLRAVLSGGTNEYENVHLRFRCLELALHANSQGADQGNVVDIAKKYEAYIKSDEKQKDENDVTNL